MKRIIGSILLAALMGAGSFAEVLWEVDFSGTPGYGAGLNFWTIPETDPQITVNSNVTGGVLSVFGGTADTTNWVYSADGEAVFNTDLYTSTLWGNPTRMDIGLGLAAAGKEYTITSIEVVVAETNSTDITLSLFYATDSAALNHVESPKVTIPAGSSGTFVIDATLLNLIANDDDATWNTTAGKLKVNFAEATGTNTDNVVISSITVNGMVEDYVAPVAVEDPVWNFNTVNDVEGWTQYGNAHISGLDVLPAFSGSETVLTCSGITGNDPQLIHYGLYAPASNYWYEAEIRVRQLDTVGTPLPWASTGCAVVIGDDVVATFYGDDVTAESGEWITATFDITSFSSNVIEGLRIDPVGQWEGTNKLFEVDYIKLTSTATPPELELPDDSFFEFNTPGDLEGWSGADGLGVLEIATSDGGESVLTSQEVTGADPKLNGPSLSPGSLYWTTLEVRVRHLDPTNGVPLVWDPGGCSVVVNGTILTGIGQVSGGWEVTTESNEWIVATRDISQFGSDKILNIRLDPTPGTDRDFELDYIRLHKATSPEPPETDWQFNTIGDVEGWTGTQLTNLKVTNSVSGSEIVLTSDGLLGNDPTLNKGGLFSSRGYYWTTAEMRVRQLDSVGNPLPFTTAGTVMVLNGTVFQGAPPWVVFPEEAGEWVVCKIDISRFGNDDLNGMRIDPVGNDPGKNFEVDYIRLNYTFIEPVKTLVKSWEFNTPGDVEGFTGKDTTDLTVDDAVSGDESVLTCADVTGIDPNVSLPYNAAISPGDGPWTTLEIRMRQLSGNPPSGAPQTWSGNGTLFFLNMGYPGSVNLGGIPGPNVTITTESNSWIVAEIDISSIGIGELSNFRLDMVGNDATLNFEIDWIRAYANKPLAGYDAWAYLYGLRGYHADKGADPDEDDVDNLTEFAFGGNPTDDEDIGIPCEGSVVNVGSNVLQVVYFRRSGDEHNLTYSLDTRNDLIIPGWSDLTGYTEAGSGQFNGEMDAVTNYLPIVSDVQFIRVEAVEQ